MTDSQDLLAEYRQNGSDAAFQELVARFVDLVHSTALRLVEGDTHRAEDVTQTVFVDLARHARTLPHEIRLGGWLHRHTCFVAANTLRGERRRQAREKQAAEMNALQNHSEADFSQVAPLLDEAINELGEADRTAILLRFFEQQDFRAVGQALGSNEDAARMRVARALDKLAEFLKRRGVTTSAASIGVVLTANAVQAAPVGLAVTISTAAALAGKTLATTATATAVKTIAMTTLQKTLVTATIAILAGAGIYEARQASRLSEQVQTLQQQQAPLVEQVQQLQKDREESARQLAALRDDNERLKHNPSELLKLRAEVTRLRTDSLELARLKSKGTESNTTPEDESWIRRISLLKQRVEQTPEAKIPELQLLTEHDWMEAAQKKLETEEDFHRAFSDLRSSAQSRFLDKAGPALQKYLAANSNQFPAEVLQLKPFFEKPPDDALLLRYQVVPASDQPLAGPSEKTEGWVITPKFQEEGGFIALGQSGGVSHTVNSPEMRILAPAIQAMFEATPVINGRRSADIHQLGPFLTTAEQKAAYERLMGNRK